MNVFISWSGARSKAVAEVLQDWVGLVIQAARPWLSDEIDRGASWMTAINNKLQDSTIGIFCLTPENKDSPWILFEAGAVAKGRDTARICTLLIEMQHGEVDMPLAQFNHTLPTRSDMLKLVKTLNSAVESEQQLSVQQLEKSFAAHWEAFHDDYVRALADNPPNTPPPPKPDQAEVLQDILATVRASERRLASAEAAQAMRWSDVQGVPLNNLVRLTEYAPTVTQSSPDRKAVPGIIAGNMRRVAALDGQFGTVDRKPTIGE
ncbi:TIR domain-containing protein [Variovorax sp. LG9.2]|uniref:TIR domain-containing protein n=1 Tax=Variovorax sp. LG9.2 TaxID=3048626 RepID=UPI002B234BDB|nr:TIR domain-containing protein [Variovorax sp. LG9.2]MEB0056471.1 TIR domain-containing protein [Variovorax sp. LG9.2]